ncbi:rrna methylase [Ophiostoma piceae UAMH 11346]|uniref:rRNA methyltransferase 1, mitochondrial n=1 Tax=Ophiostoma piceae (strain UAMH 11346) TaxID=1262450 RepID=S3CFC2_OPHP1|nr:rrna methylase [Ophiostoma piceae UAMH 11346]
MPAFTSPAVMARLSSPRLLQVQYTQALQSTRFAGASLALSQTAIRNSSMSAIVRGVRRSFRDPDGRRPPGRNPAVAAHVSERRRAREAAGPVTYKILRGKKDVTEPAIPKAKTRRARFFDPEDDYGKKSIVYQAKSGALEAEVNALRRELKPNDNEHSERAPRESRGEAGEGWGQLDKFEESGNKFERRGTGERRGGFDRKPDAPPRRFGNDRNRDFNSRDDRPRERTQFDRSPRSDRSSRDVPAKRDAPWMSRGGRDGRERRETFVDRNDRPGGRDNQEYRGNRFGRDDREDRGDRNRFGRGDREDRGDRNRFSRDDRGAREDRSSGPSWGERDNEAAPYHNNGDAPLSMPYTTAASHFLYGRSVVEAALRSSRRKLYTLYLYGGSSKNSDTQTRIRNHTSSGEQPNEILERLAKRKGVEVKIVDERWQRLLDKMSKGRPHNGIVLEASPLPQPPLVALQKYNESVGFPRGFNIRLDHQSREDAEINGEATFVPVRTPALPDAKHLEEQTAVPEQEEATVEETVAETAESPVHESAVEAVTVEATSEEAPTESGGEPASTESSAEEAVVTEITPTESTAETVAETTTETATITDANAITRPAARTTTPPRFYRPLVVLLEQVLDPGNLGAILRSASFLGVSAVVVSRHGSATLSSVALKASAGASEDLPLFSVDKPADFLALSRKAGWKVYSTVPKPTFISDNNRKSYDLDGLEQADPLRKQPCILVIGSEGEGLSRAIRRKADAEVTIPNQSGSNAVDSLNVSVATGLVCASFLRGATRVSNEAERENAKYIADEFDGESFDARPQVKDELDIWN